MDRSPRHFVWVVAACATLCAHVARGGPGEQCRACDESCHAVPTATCCHETTSGDTSPCRCQLDAREDQPLGQSRVTLRTLDPVSSSAVSATATPPVPQVLAVSREYLAASLAVPIRPPRILFGVWRN